MEGDLTFGSFSLDELNLDIQLDALNFDSFDNMFEPQETHTEQRSHFIVICTNEEQDELIREKFNLGLKTKSGRGKYETNIIQADQLIDLF